MSRAVDKFKSHTYVPNQFYDYLAKIEDAASGDVDLVILPAMTGDAGNEEALKPAVSVANDAEESYAFDVTLKVMNKAKTKLMEWYNGTLEVKVDITSTSGTIAIDDGEQGGDATENVTFENGVCTFTVTLGGTWAEDDTIKVTVDDSNVGIMGYTVEKNDHFLVKIAADPVGEG